MSEQTEIELIHSAARRDSLALERLFQKYLPMIRHLLGGYNLTTYDIEDWFQEARIVCFRACVTYDPSSGSVFSAYYRRCFQNRLNSIMRRELAFKRQSNQYCVSVDEKPQVLANLISETDSEQAQQLKGQLLHFQEYLSSYEQFCFLIMLGTKSVGEIMAATDTTALQVGRGMDRCRIKFMKFMH